MDKIGERKMLDTARPLALTYIRAVSSSDVPYLRPTGGRQMTALTSAAVSRYTMHCRTANVTSQPETIPKIANTHGR